jgi:hypothetical protein
MRSLLYREGNTMRSELMAKKKPQQQNDQTTDQRIVELNGLRVDGFRLFVCLLLALVVLAACSGPVNTGAPTAPKPVGTFVPLLARHVGFLSLQVCLDITGSYYPSDEFNQAKQEVSNAIDAAVAPNTDGLVAYVGVIAANSYQDESSSLFTIEVPKIDPFSPPPVLLPPPTPTGDPYTDSTAVRHVNAANAQAQANYQAVLKDRYSQLAQVRARVHAQTNRLRAYAPPVSYGTDEFGCLERGARRLQTVRGDKLILLSTDLQNTTMAEYVNGLNLSGIRVKVMFFRCADAGACADTTAWFTGVCQKAHVKSLNFYDVAQSRSSLVQQGLFS